MEKVCLFGYLFTTESQFLFNFSKSPKKFLGDVKRGLKIIILVTILSFKIY